MVEKLRNIWFALRGSLWFVPFLMSLGGFALAYVSLTAETGMAMQAIRGSWWMFSGDAAGASDLMSTLLSSMITMTTLAVSITMIVLSLAASQLGPRLIRSFMSDKTTQIVLGVFAMTIAYLLLVRRTIVEGLDPAATPHLAVTLGSALTLGSIFILFYFVHHLAVSLVSNNVVHRVACDLRASLDRLLPRKAVAGIAATAAATDAARVGLDKEGYVQAVAFARLVDAARRADAVLHLEFRPGHFLVRSRPSLAVSPPSALTGRLKSEIEGAIVVGAERTATQDIEYSIRHLVEIGLRALSPGVNDPFTAQTVLDHLGAALAEIFARSEQSGTHRDSDGAVRVVAPVSDVKGMIEASFNQLRQAGADHPAILIHLFDVLGGLAPHAASADQRTALASQAEAALRAARGSAADPFDLDEIERRYGLATDAFAASWAPAARAHQN